MDLARLSGFKEVWCHDFEFGTKPGERPDIICLAARELRTGRKVRLWHDELRALKEPPYDLGQQNLFIAYAASAEATCHLSLGWPLPANVLDLMAEFKAITNGLEPAGETATEKAKRTKVGKSLLGAMRHYGLGAIEYETKKFWQEMAGERGSAGPYTEAEKQGLLDYCDSDGENLERLLPLMLPRIRLDHALFRGKYSASLGLIEHRGIPIDLETYRGFRDNWDDIKHGLVAKHDEHGLFDGASLNKQRFSEFVIARDIAWPRRADKRHGEALDLKEKVFQDMAKAHPILADIHTLAHSLNQLKLADLAVGHDGRNRTPLWPFGGSTGRNQPSSSRYIFGNSKWIRHLIKPEPGMGVAYLDWEQQEFGIMAALSGDERMKEAYCSGDAYMAFAIQAGAAPAGATKATHSKVRDQYKACALALNYGMGAEALAGRIGQPVAAARELIRAHRRLYPTYWAWVDRAVEYALWNGRLYTTFGWTRHVGTNPNPRSLMNFPAQANGGDMLRWAALLGLQAGVGICALVHDAVLIEAPLDELDGAVEAMRTAMTQASEIVLGGFPIRVEEYVIRYPDRYQEKRGAGLWETATRVLGEITSPTSGDYQC